MDEGDFFKTLATASKTVGCTFRSAEHDNSHSRRNITSHMAQVVYQMIRELAYV